MSFDIEWALRDGQWYAKSITRIPQSIPHEYCDVQTGKILPPGLPFPYYLKSPRAQTRVSIKCLQAMKNFGLGHYVDEVLQKKRRSIITPDFVWDRVMKFSNKTVPRCDWSQYNEALQDLRDKFNVTQKLTPLPFNKACEAIPQSTSPGLPWIISNPGKKKPDILAVYKTDIRHYWDRVGKNEKVNPLPDCCAFARSHISSPEVNKVTPIWAYPLHVIVEEARYSSPLIAEVVEQRIFKNSGFGTEMLKGGMHWLNMQAQRAQLRDKGCGFVMTDFTAFDASVPAWLIRDCFKIIREKFDLTEEDEHQFRRCVNYFITTPVRNCDGRRFLKTHGIPSGSMFNTIIRSMVNYIVIMVGCKVVFGTTPHFMVVVSNDVVTCVPSDSCVDLTTLSNMFGDVFGLTLNIKKSFWTQNISNIHFRGYSNNDGTPMKETLNLIASLVYHQYHEDSWEYCVCRALGCLLAACGSNAEVFRVCSAVYFYAAKHHGAVDTGLELIRKNPRAARHLKKLGADEWKLTPDFFLNQQMSLPSFQCSKIMKGIEI